MKEITFQVKMNFTEKISCDAEKQLIASNIAYAIMQMAEESGISSEDSDGMLKEVSVTERYSDANFSVMNEIFLD